ncbi:MAG: exo-beta-N-acetylmuramidase NamZ family protein [Bacteroidia bacterium]
MAILVANVFLSFQNANEIKTGADQPEKYLPLIKGKKVAVVANQTSVLLPKKQHLVDFLVDKEVNLVRIFAPEHGFRGNYSAGAHVKNGKDSQTGLPIVSLYGNNKKPTADQMAGLDILIFDIQDVGARFYTYISTMHYVMEAAAENGVKVLVLDRPNPHGWHVEGPVLKDGYQSFVGMHHVPIIHGMTIGEYAKMINSEGWLKNGVKCDLEIVKMKSWTHKTQYSLPIAPSPNLPNDLSINLYPSLCLFEGTPISVGRGTNTPFQVIGHPSFKPDNLGQYSFTPLSIPGVSKYPKHENKLCYGKSFSVVKDLENITRGAFDLGYLIKCYQTIENKDDFFTPFFNKLAGNGELQNQIKNGISISEIEKSWQPDLDKFKKTRTKYLLYP